MGARNAIAAYHRWAGKLPPMSMQLLVFMALVSKDTDDWPWFGLGQAALAEMAMGREKPSDSDVRAVSRAMTPLLDAGAVTVERAATHRAGGNSTARYRLNLHAEADAARAEWEQSPDGKRRMADPRRKSQPKDGNRRVATPAQDPSHTTESGEAIRRKPASHTTVCDEPYDGNRRTKEKENYKRSEKTKEEERSSTASHAARATGGDTNVIQFPAVDPHVRARVAGKAAMARSADAIRRRAEDILARKEPS